MVTIQLIGLKKIFDKIPENVQWLCAFAVPTTKAINDHFIRKLVTEAALPENVCKATFIGNISNNIAYSFWTAIFLATSATI